MLGFTLAVCAGLCAASASASAKLALSGAEIALLCQRLEATVAFQRLLPDCSTVTVALRVCSFLLLFLFNALMWTLFVKSLQLARSSLQATMTNASANLFFTAVIGHMMFGESLTMTWGLGSTLIILGLWFIHKGGVALDKG